MLSDISNVCASANVTELTEIDHFVNNRHKMISNSIAVIVQLNKRRSCELNRLAMSLYIFFLATNTFVKHFWQLMACQTSGIFQYSQVTEAIVDECRT